MIIEIAEDIVKKCESFADARMEGSSNLYRYRGEQNKAKMREDIVIGTLAEWAAFEYLRLHDVATSEPDMKIYEKRRKSFSADLVNDQCRFHVKSQGKVSSERYGMSWLLQKTDRILKDPGDDEYFVFVSVDAPKAEVLGIVKVKDIVEADLVGKPKVPRYAATKHALYWEEIKGGNVELWRF